MTAMWRRGLALLGCFGLLAATGVASGTPCCTLTHLADRASMVSPDCCDNSDCCRGEKRESAEVTLSVKTSDMSPRAHSVPASPLLPGRISGMVLAAFGDRAVVNEHSPPLDRSRTRLLISLFRI